jgi:hypothetical protein
VKFTLSEAQIRGLLGICMEDNGDAVRVEPMHQPGPSNAWVPINDEELFKKASPVRVDVYGVPGGWTSDYWVRVSGVWLPPNTDTCKEPVEV